MDYEKEYKGALERAKKLYHYDDGKTTAAVAIACATIFPELEDNDDEKIREDLIGLVVNNFPTIWQGHYKKDIITWLKKLDKEKEIDTTDKDCSR